MLSLSLAHCLLLSLCLALVRSRIHKHTYTHQDFFRMFLFCFCFVFRFFVCVLFLGASGMVHSTYVFSSMAFFFLFTSFSSFLGDFLKGTVFIFLSFFISLFYLIHSSIIISFPCCIYLFILFIYQFFSCGQSRSTSVHHLICALYMEIKYGSSLVDII